VSKRQPISERVVLQRRRDICLARPGASETVTFGHPAFQVNRETFAVLEEYKGELSISVAVGKQTQDLFLKDSRFYRTPYIGHRGWVSLKVHSSPLNWREVKELVAGSHEIATRAVRQRTSPRQAAKTAPKRTSER